MTSPPDKALQRPKISLIVARGRNGVIGTDGDLPWRLPDDLKFFKRTTAGCPLIMGRKTWDSLPRKPLPGRPNIVLSRTFNTHVPGAFLHASAPAALATAQAMAIVRGNGEVFVTGGAAIYAETLPLADRLYITEVDAAPAGDTYFPDVDAVAWTLTPLLDHPTDDRHPHAFKITRWDRKP